MNRNPIKAGCIAAVLATASGCAVDQGYQLPPLSGGSSEYSTYGPYVGGYSGYGSYYGPYSPYYYGPSWRDPRYAYGWYGPNGYGGYPYYGGSYGWPVYVYVPCADDNHDGRCDKKPRHPGDDGHPHDGSGGGISGGAGNHHSGNGEPRDRDGEARPRNNGGTAPWLATSPDWQLLPKQPRAQPQLQPPKQPRTQPQLQPPKQPRLQQQSPPPSPPRRADPAPPEPKAPRIPRDDYSKRQ